MNKALNHDKTIRRINYARKTKNKILRVPCVLCVGFMAYNNRPL